ncbi:taste receptor type 2 member 13-like [Ctenodactylus gundi]
MESGLPGLFNLIIIIQFIAGTLGNGFIILVNCMDWVNRRKLSIVDRILTVLAMSRLGLIWEILANWFRPLYYSLSFVDGAQIRIGLFIWVWINHFSLWLATTLSIFYFLKIASFSQPLFLYLKWRVKKVILVTLLGSLALLVFNLMQINIHLEDWMRGYRSNTSWSSTASEAATLSQLVIFSMTMFSLVPFTVTLVSILLLIFSLWKHLRMMQLNSEGPRDPRTKAHVNALKIMVSFLLLYASYVASLLLSWVSQMPESTLVHALCLTLGLVYPSVHSFILILGNSKLRLASHSVLRQRKWGTKTSNAQIREPCTTTGCSREKQRCISQTTDFPSDSPTVKVTINLSEEHL